MIQPILFLAQETVEVHQSAFAKAWAAIPEPLQRYLIWPTIKFLIAFAIVQGIVAAMTYIERRMLGFMQARLGPNRVGPYGLFQAIADPVKLMLKEDIVPSSAERVTYFLGPMLPLIPAFVVFCLIPFGPPPMFAITRVNVGLLLILALTSTGVYGIILGGWASNNKFSLIGGLRSAAQMVSYEVPFGLSIVGVLMLCGSFDLVKIVRYQETHLWNVIPQFLGCFIFLVAMIAETNRAPFDLPEAESELVAGFHTEYSGMKFAFFMLAEYAAMLVNSCLIVSLYFGGWTLGGVIRGHHIGFTTRNLLHMTPGGFPLGGLIGVGIFVTKVMCFMLFYIWLRGTFPRFRFDQLMDLGWKWMIPLALVNIVVTGIVVLSLQSMGI
ncbi:MAG TPA: NADH-quinone oxidoreductase subunit NuoH [Thermoanaerobaculia bacterium]|nr:NADH-quinone oxidoreductase subunit NuoH [Thermoanaerobaculia bacterium]